MGGLTASHLGWYEHDFLQAIAAGDYTEVVKLADGNYYVGEHSDANTSGFLESEFMFATQRWMKLDIDRVVTKGTYGPAQDASAWTRDPVDLSKVDEVGFADLIPGSGHGSGGWVNVASFELYARPVKR